MSGGGQAMFVLCASVALLAAIGTIAFRNPLRCAVALLVHIGALAGMFLTLHAHFLAAMQLIVYAGAVVVLFVFVIMLIGPTPSTVLHPRTGFARGVAAVLAAGCGVAVAASLISLSPARPMLTDCAWNQAECGQFGGLRALGTVLFSDAVLPFEVASFLLLVAIVGAIAVARGRESALRPVAAKDASETASAGGAAALESHAARPAA